VVGVPPGGARSGATTGEADPPAAPLDVSPPPTLPTSPAPLARDESAALSFSRSIPLASIGGAVAHERTAEQQAEHDTSWESGGLLEGSTKKRRSQVSVARPEVISYGWVGAVVAIMAPVIIRACGWDKNLRQGLRLGLG